MQNHVQWWCSSLTGFIPDLGNISLTKRFSSYCPLTCFFSPKTDRFQLSAVSQLLRRWFSCNITWQLWGKLVVRLKNSEKETKWTQSNDNMSHLNHLHDNWNSICWWRSWQASKRWLVWTILDWPKCPLINWIVSSFMNSYEQFILVI